MQTSRAGLRLLAARLQAAVGGTSQGRSFAAAAAEPALAHSQGRLMHELLAQDLRFERHPLPLPQDVAPDSVRIRDVVAVGSNVTSLQVGDRVAVEPGVPCWGNYMARQGKYHLDPDVRFLSMPGTHGALADYFDHSADFCFALPENVSYESGALLEPFSCGLHACQRGQVGPGKKVAILGAGPIGLNALAAARAFAASRVVITDIRTDTFAVAEQLGAGAVLQTPASLSPARIAEELVKLLPPYGPDVVIDCAGFDSTLQTALQAVTSGGKVVIIGMGSDRGTLLTGACCVKEIDIHGCLRYCNTWPLAIELLTSGKVDLAPMISHRFPFSAQGIQDGFHCAQNPKQYKTIKTVFHYDEA